MTRSRRVESPIVLATDFFKPAQRAFWYALALAKALDRPLVILHVLKGVSDHPSSVSLGHRTFNSMKTAALLHLGRLVRLAQEDGVRAEPLLQTGHPASCILEVLSDSDARLTVMGTHGRTGWDRLQLGSTADAMIRQAACPVLTVQGVVAGDTVRIASIVHLERLLIATDFSTGARAAFRVGAALAERVRGTIMILHVVEVPDRTKAARQRDEDHANRSSRKQASGQAYLNKLVRTLKARGVAAEGRYETGKPIEVILEQAAQWAADAIVIGTRGGKGLPRLLLGGLAEQLVRRAGCPVISISPAAARSRF